ncbi:MAG: MaoC family dehydratase [Firmicutes bacterium]|nr:MaoC family dehydratase [Bacillota bacterium]
MRKGKTINEIEIGDEASFSKTIFEADIVLFGAITGDFNPMHFNEEYAKTTPFKTRIAHGGIAGSLIAPVLGMMLPGLGTIALETKTRYLAPVKPGDTITATGKVVSKDIGRNTVVMELTWKNQKDKLVMSGEATVMPPRA